MSQETRPPSQADRDAAAAGEVSDSGAFAHLAEAYRKEGLLDDAIRICREGLAALPNYVSARVVLGRALLEQGALEDAEAEFGHVLRMAADHVLALQSLGSIHSQRGRWREARECYERVLRLNPLDRKTKDALASLPAEEPPVPELEPAPVAEAMVEAPAEPTAAIAMAPSEAIHIPEADPLASATLAGLYASQGHPAEAEAIYAQLDRQPEREVSPVAAVEVSDRREAGVSLSEMLHSFREGARRVRAARRES